MEKMRYVLYPGYITSETDLQEHFIGGPRLAALYGLDFRIDNIVYGDDLTYRPQHGDVHLYPRCDGDYTLPE